MSATRLFRAGYKDLVSVIPPDGELTFGSKIQPEQRGKCPGLLFHDGWGGYGWLKYEVHDPESFDRWGANIGLKGTNFPAVDIDIDDPKISGLVSRHAMYQLGSAPIRHSKAGRLLRMYRLEGEPFGSMKLTIEGVGLVEILADRKQYLVHGTHPSGAQYRWKGGDLWNVPVDALTRISQEEAQAFLESLRDTLGYPATLSGSGDLAPEVPIEKLMAPSIEELEALPLPPNPEHFGWEEFITYAYAYAAASHEDPAVGKDLWKAWASQHDSYNEDECDAQWDKGFHNPRVGWDFLQDRVDARDTFQATGEPPPDPEDVRSQFGAEEPRAKRPKYWTIPNLMTMPDPVWQIEEKFGVGSFVAVYGPPGAGKSFLALGWTLSIASGIEWLGHEVKQGRGLYLAGEGISGLKHRVHAWVQANNGACPEDSFLVYPDMVSVGDAKAVNTVIKDMADMSYCPTVIVVDTLARAMGGLDENSTQDMGKFIQGCDLLRKSFGCTVVVVHHTGKAGNIERGNSALRGAADSMFLVTQEEGSVTVKCTKQKETDLGETMQLWLMPSNGSCVLEPDDGRAAFSLEDRVLTYVQENPGVSMTKLRQAMKRRHDTVKAAVLGQPDRLEVRETGIYPKEVVTGPVTNTSTQEDE